MAESTFPLAVLRQKCFKVKFLKPDVIYVAGAIFSFHWVIKVFRQVLSLDDSRVL